MRVQETTSFVSPDLLTMVLQELRFTSAAYRWLELGAPYRVGFVAPGLRGVHLVARGSCLLVLPGAPVQPLQTGDLVILPHGDPHELRSGAEDVPVVGSLALAAAADGTRLRAGSSPADTVVVCGAFLAGDPEHPALRGLPSVIRVPAQDGRPPAWLAPYVEALRTEAFEGGPGSDLVMARLSDALLVRALRHHAGTVGRPGWLAGLGDPYVAVALKAMHTDPAQPWTVGSLAAAAGLSRAAFAARFTERVGQPAIRYLQSLRLHRAKVLLRAERATVASVAAQVGYTSDVAFAAAFKREAGLSPGAYRRASLPA